MKGNFMKPSRSLAVWACLLLIVAVSAAHGQVLYGSLTGVVTDPSSAVIPNAKVEAREVNTGVTRSTPTDSRGSYLFTNIASGSYTITVTATSGFQPVVESGIVVTANEVRRTDVRLQISTATQTVEVSATAIALQSDKADVHDD